MIALYNQNEILKIIEIINESALLWNRATRASK